MPFTSFIQTDCASHAALHTIKEKKRKTSLIWRKTFAVTGPKKSSDNSKIAPSSPAQGKGEIEYPDINDENSLSPSFEEAGASINVLLAPSLCFGPL
ncbi:hypothetical protein AVEN_147195-1 [Araneus ventricosus]|uniref:Uncharacterized protein n=1 Tax=Araneus ventricosus TaxID=182803 RepID=A0A4Y2U3Y5_ARAVE|nr:hypothetical protein AVEN_61949-1 [Araneus ventricosus]GBO06374.1 hypothetical protein AVEN_147195-1 [Araneus ventricosus]